MEPGDLITLDDDGDDESHANMFYMPGSGSNTIGRGRSLYVWSDAALVGVCLCLGQQHGSQPACHKVLVLVDDHLGWAWSDHFKVVE